MQTATTNPVLEGLNEKQIQAVLASCGPVLVISGPGSGKTKCLTHRIAHLIATGVRPDRILAVTFTNKAAGEIKERVTKLLGSDKKRLAGISPTLGTFHSLGVRILRRDIGLLGYGEGFSILDASDQEALVKKIIVSLGFDTKQYDPRAVRSRISKLKTNLIAPADAEANSGFGNRKMFAHAVAEVYERYQHELEKANAVDFDDLIGLPVRLFRQYPQILEKYQSRWDYVLVDEYQDTSHDQYTLVKLLAAKHRNIFCIGDDAQSIYMFREADIRNILNFEKDYPEANIILLEQNYRSTKNIISAAQGVISNNKSQIPKNLWTSNERGEQVIVQETADERHEADFIAEKVHELLRKDYRISDVAVLYRTHAQSRAIEEALIGHGIPYQIVGGIRFYERREIKDILAYLRFLNNPADRVSFERIFSVPPRGIGKSAMDKVISADTENFSSALLMVAKDTLTPPRQAKALKKFHDLLEKLNSNAKKSVVSATIKSIVRLTEYEAYLSSTKDKFETAEERLENIKELLTVARKYDSLGPDGSSKFLEEVALLQDADRIDPDEKQITLMTMHSSKGLEFPVVFVAGMEEGLFPHSRSIFDASELEEERRLCYVALTRAKERIFITLAKFRRIFGSAQANLPSRFIGEMPKESIAYNALAWEDNIIDY